MNDKFYYLIYLNDYLMSKASKKKSKKKKKKSKKKTQLEPLSTPVSQLYPNKIYPEGEICEYKNEYVEN